MPGPPLDPRPDQLALLIEDNVEECAAYAAFFQLSGIRLLIAHSAAEGFRLAVAEQPGVIIADVRLDGGPDGLTLAMKLRLDARTRHIPILALTGSDPHTTKRLAEIAGCDAFLEKPCPPDVLVEHARTLIAAAAVRR